MFDQSLFFLFYYIDESIFIGLEKLINNQIFRYDFLSNHFMLRWSVPKVFLYTKKEIRSLCFSIEEHGISNLRVSFQSNRFTKLYHL